MTEQEVNEHKQQIRVHGTRFEVKVALLLLAELVVAVYKIAKEVNNIAKRIP